MAFSNLKVVRVMCRCDLYAAGSEFLVNIGIRNDRDLTVYDRKQQLLSDDVFVTLIIRVYRNRRITEHRLRSGRRDLHKSAFLADDRIVDMPEKSILLLMFYFRVRNGCLADRTPVDDTGSLVDVSFFVQLDKYFKHCVRAALIHGETFSLPVCGRSEFL